jgi:hypothetical protein
VLLQNLVEVKVASVACCKRTNPGQRVLLDSLGMGMLHIAFCVHPSRVHSKATRPSSCVVMASSLLSSSLSRARSCFCSSTATAYVATAHEGEEGLHQLIRRDQRYTKRHAQATAGAE